MATTTEYPPLVKVLTRLSLNYWLLSGRIDRRKKSCQYRKATAIDAATEIERRDLSLLLEKQRTVKDALEERVLQTRRKLEKKRSSLTHAVAFVDDSIEDDVDADADHPYFSFVASISELTGLSSKSIKDAAQKKFDGFKEVVAPLNLLDGSSKLKELYVVLIREFREVAVAIRLHPCECIEQPMPTKHCAERNDAKPNSSSPRDDSSFDPSGLREHQWNLVDEIRLSLGLHRSRISELLHNWVTKHNQPIDLFPIPLRPLNFTEKVAVLAAIHDAAEEGEPFYRPIKADGAPPQNSAAKEEWKEQILANRSFEILKSNATEIKIRPNGPERAMLNEVVTALKASAAPPGNKGKNKKRGPNFRYDSNADDETMKQWKFLHNSRGLKKKDAAAQMGITVKDLERAINRVCERNRRGQVTPPGVIAPQHQKPLR